MATIIPVNHRHPQRHFAKGIFAVLATVATLGLAAHAHHCDARSAAAPVHLAGFSQTPFGGSGFPADGDDDEAQLQLQQMQQMQQAEQEAEQQQELATQEAQQAEQQGLLTEQQATLSVPGS
ncbi:hypothetical protein [Mycobacterium sp. 050134]|uniref:hypothetical protein n=1 Tax=Mycobacterium sp. 050134 TaxID=3096111 RepID=UPI002ED81737